MDEAAITVGRAFCTTLLSTIPPEVCASDVDMHVLGTVVLCVVSLMVSVPVMLALAKRLRRDIPRKSAVPVKQPYQTLPPPPAPLRRPLPSRHAVEVERAPLRAGQGSRPA